MLNITDYKTTSIGLVLLIFGLFLQYQLIEKSVFEFNYPVACIGIAGIAFIFSPDTVIDYLKKLIEKK